MLASIHRHPALRAPTAFFFGACVLLISHPGGVARSLEAQSIVRSEIDGTVRDSFGQGIPEVGITVARSGSDVSRFVESNRAGSFLVSMLEAGDYDVLVEAIGYIPRLVRNLRVRPGQIVRFDVSLVATPTPPLTVDTVAAGGVGHPRFDGETGRWISRSELAVFSDPRMGLDGIASMAPMMDEALGSEGLPGILSGIYLDGIPFTPAAHPLQTSGARAPLFPRSALSYVDVHRRSDIEWAGAAGSYVTTASRPGSGNTAIEGFASGAAGPLWGSEGFTGKENPGSSSVWGGATADLALDEAGTRIHIGIEGASTTTPHLSPFTEDLAQRLVDAAPSSAGATLTDLTSPWTSNLRAISGLGRLDWSGSGSADVAIRASFATVSEEGSAYFGPALAYGSTPSFAGTDLSLAGLIMAEAHRLVTIEGRLGVERSTREWSGPEGSTDPSPFPGTRFVDAGVFLGAQPGLAGTVNRTGFVGSGVAHYRDGPHWLKGGLSFSFASHQFEHVFGSAPEFLFSDPEAIAIGEGVLRQNAGGSSPTASFSIPEFGVFAQYRWEPMPGIRITTGARYDRELLPDDAVPIHAGWDFLTGLKNEQFAKDLGKFSPRLGASWDLGGDGGTIVEATMGAHFEQLDPAALAELVSLSGPLIQRQLVGDIGTTWPEPPADSEFFQGFRRTIALFGPDLQAPRTARASFGLSQRLGDASVLHFSGTIRRTEFLLRRDDLNLAIAPSGALADGRPVYGTLVQTGAIIAPQLRSNRRFDEYSHVWALNSDGVSEYQSATVALEHAASATLDLFASYTYATTEDNLLGAATPNPGAQIVPTLNSTAGSRWTEGVSDFDVPHRIVAGVRSRFAIAEGVTVSGIYRFRSGRPFTAGFRPGVDVNGDGSGHNDPAFVPQNLSGLDGDRSACVRQDLGQIARRNGCRGPAIHQVDLHLTAGILRIGASVASLTVDLFNLLDADFGAPDSALLLIDPNGTIQRDSETRVSTLPVTVNPNFGEIVTSVRPGRLVRIGFSLTMP